MRAVEWESEFKDGTFMMSERHLEHEGVTACGKTIPKLGATIIYTQKYPTCGVCLEKTDGFLRGTGMRNWHDVYNYTMLSGKVNPVMISTAEEIYVIAGPFAALAFIKPHTMRDEPSVIQRVGKRRSMTTK